MTQFSDREKAFEAKFARDSELGFKVQVRRNRMLGLWAAGLMGLTGEAAEAYAKEVVAADFVEAGDDDVYRKVKGDLDAKGLQVSEHQVRREMASLLEAAKRELGGAA